MGLYKLKTMDENIETGVLEKVKTDSIDYEKDFENWLENSPSVLLDDDAESTVFWIGRQVSATVGETDKYPDLIGIDASGDLVIVELKKGKTPREVVAQILEYAAWGAALKYGDLNKISQDYYRTDNSMANKSLIELYHEVFLPDNDEEVKIDFNKNQKLYIVAEQVSAIVKQVAVYLREKYGVNVYCMEYEVLKTQQEEYFISTEKIVGYDDITSSISKNKISGTSAIRWNEPIKIKTVISDAVNKITNGKETAVFTPAEVYSELIKQYPDINQSTVRCQVIQDCVNHTSRKHYPSGQRDLYFRSEKGRYRLYNAEKDGKWDWQGRRIE
ncbi:hypothetical protein SAMN02745134_00943 [Clostridium acidisoli DSM 12555]|uniref:DUF7669 domain-containing protein n=1 Tax=Clostridium acidisoli DSM 12555 TaxID=1121291 RepID=A0A1W1X8H6_9CLOT|nr:hypothetical protein [Clostridium acidisoli]SMC19801.1 hypothetical protein SAMN02745134_00943 [Clostridium acidisoli DSM 12555]